MDNLKSSPCLKRNYREPVYSPALHFAAFINSAFSGAVFNSLFLPQKSLMRLLLNHTFLFCSVTIHHDFNVNSFHLHPCNFLSTMTEILGIFLLQILVFPFFTFYQPLNRLTQPNMPTCFSFCQYLVRKLCTGKRVCTREKERFKKLEEWGN